MSIIWLIENPNVGKEGIAGALMGDHAVRLFASIESFQKLLRFNRQALPDLIIVDMNCSSWQSQRLTDLLTFTVPDVSCLLFANSELQREEVVNGHGHIFWLCRPSNNLDLSQMIKNTLLETTAAKTHRAASLLFKDLQLDFERFQIRLLPEMSPTTLPLKEAQILKMLLETPEKCISREEIINHLWDGVKVTPRTIDSHISRLRRRLEGAEVQIESVYGGGYVLR